MATPEINHDVQAVELLPEEQRLPLWIIFIRALFSPIKWLYGVFTGFQKGEDLDLYDDTVTYSAGYRVQYRFATYESLVDDNTGNTPSETPDYWILRNTEFIGAEERVKYNGQKIVLEYALNRYFRTAFSQPPATSEIYITNVVPVAGSFIMRPTSSGSSKMYPTTSSGFMLDPPVYLSVSTYKFTIHIPLAVYTALASEPEQREAIVRGFADRYVLAGTIYDITPY